MDAPATKDEHSTESHTAVAVFILGTIATKRGGVTRAVLARMRLFAEAGVAVKLLLTDHSSREDQEERAIRNAWALPASVQIRYFWREATPSGGGAPCDSTAHAESESGLTSFTEHTEAEKVVRFYHHGLLVKTKYFDHDGILSRTNHHDAARRTLSREHYDPHGLLVRVDDVNPDTGKVALRRWFDRSGACWLTGWLNGKGGATKAVRHRPSPVAYDHFGQCVAEWIDAILAQSTSAVVFADTRSHDPVLLALTNPQVRTVAVLHNGHTSKPYRSGDPTKATWRPLIDNITKLDAVVALTQRQAADIEQRADASEITVINHCTPPIPTLAINRQPGLLVAVSRLETQKRLEHAIRAFAVATREAPDTRFDIYGTGTQAHQLRSLVTELDIGDRVRFRGFTENALEVFAGASAMVLSSQYEGWGLVINEAMAVGTPPVAYDVNYGPSDIIRHEIDGLLVTPGDVDGLAAAMARVLGNPTYATQLGERAREVAERFSAERWAREWIALFERLGGGSRPDGSTAQTGSTSAVGMS